MQDPLLIDTVVMVEETIGKESKVTGGVLSMYSAEIPFSPYVNDINVQGPIAMINSTSL